MTTPRHVTPRVPVMTVLTATYRLLYAQEAMLKHWSESKVNSPERTALWRSLHLAADDLRKALRHNGEWPI